MSFDSLAPHYRWMEFVLAGEKLQRCRTKFLDEIPAVRQILLLGEGHGRGLAECRRRFSDAQIICLDASGEMLTQSRRRLMRLEPAAGGVEFIQADVLTWTPSGHCYDLVVTNFFLDCFRADQLERIIPRLAAATAAEANWLVADFQAPLGGPGAIRSRLILWTMYVFFRAVTRLPARTLTAPDKFLEKAGFTLHRRAESEWGLLHSDWWRRKSGCTR